MARNNAYRVNRPNYKARMEANEYRDYLNEKRKETNRLKKIETDNLYNENTFGGNVWRNTKKFASVALPALIGYGLLKGKHVGLDANDGPGMFALKSLGAGLAAAPAVGAGAVLGVVPYTYLRQMEAENSRRDEAYEQFKHMQNKVLAENNLLNYQSPKSNLPGSTFFPRSENVYSPRTHRDQSEAILSAAKHVGTNIAKGASKVATAGANHPIIGGMVLGAATTPVLKSKILNGLTGGKVEKLNEETPLRFETQPDQSEHEEVKDLSCQLKDIKEHDPEKYELKLERALDTLSEEDKQKLLDLMGPYEAIKSRKTPCLDKILAKTFSEEKVGENASEYAKIPITPNFGKVPDLKDEVLSDATLDFKKKEEKKNNGEIQTTKTVETSVTKTSPQTNVSVGFSECNYLNRLLHKDFDDKPSESSGSGNTTSGSDSGSSSSGDSKKNTVSSIADALLGEGTSKHFRRAAKVGMVVNGAKGLVEGAKESFKSKGDSANPTDIN